MNEVWTFTATWRGYMFYKNGQPWGGAASNADGPGRGHSKRKQMNQHIEYAKAECARRNAQEVKA